MISDLARCLSVILAYVEFLEAVLYGFSFNVIRPELKLVLSSAHDGSVIMWGAGGGLSDKINVSY